MAIEIRLLKEYDDFKVGDIYKVTGDVQDLLDKGIAELYTAPDPAEQATRDAALADVVKDAVAGALGKETKLRPLVTVEPKRFGERPAERMVEKSMWENSAIHPSWKGCVNENATWADSEWKNIQHFLRDISGKAYEMVEADDPQGGYLVPTALAANIYRRLLSTGGIIGRCTRIPFPVGAGSGKTFPTVEEDATGQASGKYFGALELTWLHELGDKNVSKPTLSAKTLRLNKLAGMIKISNSLLDDSAIGVEEFVASLMTEAIRRLALNAIGRGTGAGQPLGILNAPGLIVVAAEVPQAASSIVLLNVLHMWERMTETGRENAVWLINPTCVHQIYTMGLAIGVGGSVAMVSNASSYAERLPEKLLGRPIIWTAACTAALGAQGCIVLADLSKYLILDRSLGAPEIFASPHRYMDQDLLAVRIVSRLDGQPMFNTAYEEETTGQTVYDFVTLAATP